MRLLRRLYRRARPAVAVAVSRHSSDRILTRIEVLDGPRPGLTVYRYGSDERYGFEPPRHVGALPDALRAKVGECTVPPPFLVEVADATVIGPTGIAVADGRVVLESTLGSYERLVDSSVRALLAGQIPVETRLQRPDDRYDDPVFSLVGPWATDYYHWLAAYLVQVFALETFRDRTGDDPLVLVPAEAPSWLTESLPLAGIDPDQTIEWSGTRARCSRLVLGSARHHTASTGDGYIHSPAALSRLGRRIRMAVAGAESVGSRRLYVSRADAVDRRVRNEPELVEALRQYDFERFVPSEHTFAEQVRRFSDAEVVLGPHGAGLTNLIFTPSATLVELFGSYHNACFFTLAQGMGNEYACATAQSVDMDLIVDVEVVTSLLEELLADV